MDLFRRLVSLLAAVLVLATVIVVFTALGSSELAAPPWRPSAWGAWATSIGPLPVVFALLRLLVLALAWYCLAAVLLTTVAGSAMAAAGDGRGDVLTPPLLRPALHRALGISLATTLLLSPDVAVALPPPVDAPASGEVNDENSAVQPAEVDPDEGRSPSVGPEVADRLPSAGRDVLDEQSPPARLHGADGSVPPVLEWVTNAMRDESRDLPTARPTDSTSGAAGIEARAGEGMSRPVRPGDSLWSIAREALTTARGTAANDAVVADYWREVVEHNRDELADPTNPDLIFPGQDVRLPPIPRPK